MTMHESDSAWLCGNCGFVGSDEEFVWIERGNREPNVRCAKCGQLFTDDDCGPALYFGPRRHMEMERVTLAGGGAFDCVLIPERDGGARG